MVEQGRVRWKRFALVFTPVVALTLLLVGATTEGAIGATFVVSSSTFKLFTGELRAQGFTLAGGVDHDIKGRAIPVLLTGIRRAEVFDLCQSVVLKTPLGAVTARITGGRGDAPVVAEDLVIDAAAARGRGGLQGHPTGARRRHTGRARGGKGSGGDVRRAEQDGRSPEREADRVGRHGRHLHPPRPRAQPADRRPSLLLTGSDGVLTVRRTDRS